MNKKTTAFWKRPKPGKTKPSKPLAPNQLEAAKARAEAAGRRYPNLVDNAWAARHVLAQPDRDEEQAQE
ncbi:hypothetical protein [Lysobacter silvisoli]|uniref:Uncharacterized protein n=1 Tax=Lysobacter silvisoli TaxID=2293254 RepID=A0A371K6P4_9GAMM|nr:hypothetical protein [Lysobacter silvisoli]RDZ29520.1 hypothetical protein DX914_10720 [Lysobacter silvisoli]